MVPWVSICGSVGSSLQGFGCLHGGMFCAVGTLGVSLDLVHLIALDMMRGHLLGVLGVVRLCWIFCWRCLMVWPMAANSGSSCPLSDENNGGACCGGWPHSRRFGSSRGLLSCCCSIALTGGNSGSVDFLLSAL